MEGKNMSNKKTYYLSDSDFVYCEDEDKVYIWNYAKKAFVLTDTVIDPMTFHEFPEKELKENIQINQHLYD